MKYILLIAILITSTPAYAATAYFTGGMRHITTITGKQGVSCQYRYAGRTFWQSFARYSCPQSINI